MTYRALLTLAVALELVSGCAQSRMPPAGVRQCPLLVRGEGASQVSYGAVAGRSGKFVRGGCVEVYVGETRVGRTVVTFDHSFAVQFEVRGDAREQTLELRFAAVEGEPGEQRYTLALPDRIAARIGYEEGTMPLVAHNNGTLEFNGWLGSAVAPISDVWMVNWSTGAVADVEPTPESDYAFTGAVSGEPGQCASPLSVHGERETVVGGCWWPQGGGGCAPLCTEEARAAGMCPVSIYTPCIGGRGCTVLEVDERRSDAPPPELPDEIPIGRMDGGPPDAGPPDAGPSDAGLPDLDPDWGFM